MKKQIIVINGRWIIFFLSISLIGTLSVKWSNMQGLPIILSFAVGLTSLVLSILAIVQKIASGPTFARAVQSIHLASSEVRDSTKNLSDAGAKLEHRLEQLDELGGGIA